MDSTLKRRGNDRFHVVSTWNPRGVFVGKKIIHSLKTPNHINKILYTLPETWRLNLRQVPAEVCLTHILFLRSHAI